MKKADNFNPGKWLVENKLTFQSKLEEGVIQLTPDERSQIEEMIPRIIDVIEKKYIKPDQFEGIGYINFISADKNPGKVYVWVGNDMPSANGYYHQKDPKDLNDNYIVMQQNSYSPYFNVLWNTYSNFIGDKNMGIELLRKTLKHELIHAKDPAINQHVSPLTYKNYDSSKPELYYKSWIEFQTMTGQFFESITTGVDRIMKSDPSEENIRKIETALNDILNFYSGKSKTIKQETIDFIQDSGSRNIFQKLFKFVNDIVLGNQNALYDYIDYIHAIKKYHPEAYNEFLKDLYKTIDQCKDSINKALATNNRKGISLNKKL